MKPSEIYAASFEHVCELARNASEEQLATRVPACPEWTVKELVAHVTGVAADSMAANVSELGQPGWTQAQVDARKDLPIEDILAEWTGITEQITAALDDLHPTLASALISDLVTHELDMRGALGNKEGRHGEGVATAASFYARNFGKRLKDAGLPTLTVEAGPHQWVAGREEPVGSVKAPLFDLLRGLTGRRTLDEVKSFDWSVDPAPYLELFPMYPVTPEPLNE